ncbi:MAG: type II toxin-antitoxin system VapC family toxin [Thermodesulfobacteriota bacterium]
MRTNQFTLLNIEQRHIAKIEKLPFPHGEPFDRLLIAQAITEKLTLVSHEKFFMDYGVKHLW